MALLTKALVDEQIRDSFEALIDLSDKYNVNTMKNDLKRQIERLKSQEELFLSALGAKNLAEVNQRISQYRADFPRIQNLNGNNLYWEFLNSIEASQSLITDKEQKEFVEFFSNVQVEGLVPEDNLVEWFHSILNSVSAGTVRSTSGYEKATKVEQIILKRLTDQQKRRVREFMSNPQNKTRKGKQITVIQNQDAVTTTLEAEDWASLTKNQKKTEIEEQLKLELITQKQLDDMLRGIYNLIVSKGPADNRYFRQAVGEVVFEKSSKTKVFYAGNMLNGITGLLGEIQALFYLKSLLGDAAGAKADVAWVGGINNPHEDLILTTMGQQIGIQVKNAFKDVEKIGQMTDVSFMSKAALNFEEVRNKMGADYYDVLSIYEMDAFNIEFVKRGDEYVPGRNDAFHPSRQNIEFLSKEVDRIMALFTGALMYMSVGDEFSNIEIGNSVYILGGVTIQFASEILLNLFQKLENYEKDIGFKINAHFNKGANKIGNIADYFNSNKSKRGQSVTNSLGQLFLSSSYTFQL